MPTALACNSRDICFFPRVNKLDFRCMLLEIVVENGTQTFGEGEDEREEDDDGGDGGDDATAASAAKSTWAVMSQRPGLLTKNA